jgi:hypothetical protein
MAAETVRRGGMRWHLKTVRRTWKPEENFSTFIENSRNLHESLAARMQNTFCSRSGRKPQLTTHFVKGETMPALDTTDIDQTDADQADSAELRSTTCTAPHTFASHFTMAVKFDEDDFLTWSSRQKDAENILEYDE